jgi:hypothetical protein
MHLGVLTEQTLEISSVVKDFTFPDPSLAKEVKDSSLTILHQIRVTSAISLAKGAHQLRKINSICFGETGSSVDLTSGSFVITLDHCLSGFINPFILSLRRACFSSGGNIVHSGSCELEREMTPNNLEVHQRVSLTPDLHFGTWFQWFGGHLQRGRILGLLQRVRGTLYQGGRHISARDELDLL